MSDIVTPSQDKHSPRSVTESDDGKVATKHVDIHEWIRTQELMIGILMKTADQTAISKWKQRQEAAKAQQCPGERGAIVYEWDRDENQSPIRTRVNRANVEQSWVMFGTKQRWFNCVDDEWELCHELEPSDMAQDIALESEADTDQDATEFNASLQGWMTKDDVNVVEAGSNILASISFKPEDIAADRRHDLGGYALDAVELISIRFGYSYVTGTRYETYPKTPITLNKALRIIGDEFETSVYTMKVGAEASLIRYLMYLNGLGTPKSTKRTFRALCVTCTRKIHHTQESVLLPFTLSGLST